MRLSPDDFRSAPFKEVARLIQEEEDLIKEAAVAYLVEPEGQHAERIGAIRGLNTAIAFMKEIEDKVYGVEKQQKTGEQ